MSEQRKPYTQMETAKGVAMIEAKLAAFEAMREAARKLVKGSDESEAADGYVLVDLSEFAALEAALKLADEASKVGK